MSELTSSDLCTDCGLCCNDAMFSHVRLHDGDHERLAAAGYPVERLTDEEMPLPCAMLAGTRCTIYANRPQGCRNFRCETLKAAESGAISMATAQARIRQAKALLARMRQALPEGVSMEMAQQRWQAGEASVEPVEAGEARSQLAFYAYHRYMDRYFRPPHKAKLAGGSGMRPET